MNNIKYPSIVLALGSNLGDRYRNILTAMSKLEQHNIKIVSTGCMYETDPMYYLIQNKFLNTVITVKVFESCTPHILFKIVKDIEREMKRVKVILNGPRTIDIDIVYYNKVQIFDKNLIVPHPKLLERNFVLRPLLDMDINYYHFPTNSPLIDISNSLPKLTKVVPLKNSKILRLDRPIIMGICNATPDSFSGDGFLTTGKVPNMECADIVDIGGESTKPGHKVVKIEEEIERIKLVIDRFKDKIISLDCRKSEVVEYFIDKIDIVNEVSGLEYDKNMIHIVKKYNIPIIINHWPNSAKSNSIEDISNWLNDKVNRLLEIGVYRWNIILDPGFGFNKELKDQIKLWNSLDKIIYSKQSSEGYPILISGSRKGHLKRLAKVDMVTTEESDLLTMLLYQHAMRQGINIFRVHNSKWLKLSINLFSTLN